MTSVAKVEFGPVRQKKLHCVILLLCLCFVVKNLTCAELRVARKVAMLCLQKFQSCPLVPVNTCTFI